MVPDTVCRELSNYIEAVEKLRTVVWANEAAATLPDAVVALVHAGSVVDAVTVEAIGALDASKEHKATGDFSPADLLPRRCRARHESMTHLDTRSAKQLFGFEHTWKLREGIERTVTWFRSQQMFIREVVF